VDPAVDVRQPRHRGAVPALLGKLFVGNQERVSPRL